MVSTGILATAVVVAAVASFAPSTVEAHGFVAKPPSEFKKGTKFPSEWVAEFGPPWAGTFRTGAQYAAVAKKKGYKNLRAFLESKGPVCGNTNAKAKAKPVPTNKKVVFSRAIVHPGPCEIWLDNKLVYHNDDCEKTFGSKIPSFPVNFASCKGSCLLRFYWLGLQDGGKRWQSYKNCVPLTTGKARSIEDGEDTAVDEEATYDEASLMDNEGVDSVDAESFSMQQDEESRLAMESTNATIPIAKCNTKRGD